MKSLSLIFFTLSIVFIVIGYMELKIRQKQNKNEIEYRFIPRNILEDQFNNSDLTTSFKDMFNKTQPYMYQNSGLENSNLL